MSAETRLGIEPLQAEALGEIAAASDLPALDRVRVHYLGKAGLLTAQLALALSGQDRDEVLAKLLELLAVRGLGA